MTRYRDYRYNLFLNNDYPKEKEIEKLGKELMDRGYDICFFPISGCTALEIDDYAVTGYSDVKRWLEDALGAKHE